MYLVAIGWLYVALMMALAEAVSSQGSVLGAIVTFLFYGLLPVAIVMYLLGTPARRAARRRAEAAEQQQASASSSAQPDGGDHAAAGLAVDALAPERKEP
ncbi:hypothetical protein G8A07_07925 [Roseateles sp. DAIF2]|uniref:hypothetical protein n=1 Tax=Roseateles sp. DAIF2 TaxID=2714952 RepID=UPI0018A28066|nr:hypothetical protein [Roseateles sp. DAIF2]QPF72866.1 hypothetical protein G8A07_07925 [Roseateles sp. DAIF2]